MKKLLFLSVLMVFVCIFSGCEKGGTSVRNSVEADGRTLSIGSAYAFWWISSYEDGSPWSNYEILLLPTDSFDDNLEHEWEFYFDIYLEGAVTNIPSGIFKLGTEDDGMKLDEASFWYQDGTGLTASEGTLEIRGGRKGYSLKFSGRTEDGTPVSASYSGEIALLPM